MEQFDNESRDFEQQRRRKAENFHLSISDDYDDSGEERRPEEINSYSGQDVKKQIEKESKKSLKNVSASKKRSFAAATAATAATSALCGLCRC